MKKSIFKRKRFWGIILVTIFFLYISIASQFHWLQNQYFWEVIQVNIDQVVIEDKDQEKHIIFLDNATRIVWKWLAGEDVVVWDVIVVRSSKLTDGWDIQADFMRIMKPKNGN